MCLNDLLSGISLSDLMVIFTMDKYKTVVFKRDVFYNRILCNRTV